MGVRLDVDVDVTFRILYHFLTLAKKRNEKAVSFKTSSAKDDYKSV